MQLGNNFVRPHQTPQTGPVDTFVARGASEHAPLPNFRTFLAATAPAADASVWRKPSETAAVRLPGLDKVWDAGFTGKGQTIAVIDSGIFPHPDLQDRIVGWADMTGEKKIPVDPYGHGTHVAGIAAGSGKKSGGQIKGVAPDANLVGVRINSVGDAIKGLQWVVENKDKYGITVVNLSLGQTAVGGWKNDPWCQAVQKAIEAGLTVVVAAGNEGPSEGTVASPGITPDAITVGGVDDQGTLDTSDDTIYAKSSRGLTPDHLAKPDVLAPAVSIYGPLSPGSAKDAPNEHPQIGKDYVAMPGTSEATPMVAGLVALLKQARPELTPHDLRQILMQSARQDGASLPEVKADAALQLARTWTAGSARSAA